MEAQELEPVRSVVIPTGSLPLVVPSAAVAEVAGFSEITPLPITAPGLVGVFQWRGVSVPVVAFETLLGQPAPRPDRRSKVVIFYPLPGRPRSDFFGILAGADPQSRMIGSDQIRQADVPTAVSNRFIAATFDFDGNTVGIPDLPAIRESIRRDGGS
jgi:chemotaxis signal transduction protein